MRLKKGLMISAIAVVGLLGLSACAADSGTTDPDVDVPEFEAGTTMADLADAGKITIGTKFDQPLFGLKGPSGDPVGFDVEIGKIIAASLGISEDNIEWKETVSAQPRAVHRERHR